MLSTLRANGGDYKACRVLAVVARYGAPMSPQTLALLAELHVELIYAVDENEVSWFNYSNKIIAVGVANRLASTPLVVWLDSDVLVAAPPSGLSLADNVDFAARCEYLPPAVIEGDMTQIPYWQALCALLSVRFEDLPWRPEDKNRRRQAIYFNSGIFVWRRCSSFASAYKEAFQRLIDSRLAQHDGSFFTADQVILSPIIIREGLRWQHLHLTDHHMIFQGQLIGDDASPHLGQSALIHYSRSLHPPWRDVFLARIRSECPHLLRFIEDQKVTRPAAPTKLLATCLRFYRGLRWKIYASRLHKAPIGKPVGTAS